jgi:hypothetical protein
MAGNRLEELKAIDPAILADVVRQDQNSSAFEITEWDIKQLSDKGIVSPEGLWVFRGKGNNGGSTQSWSVVLKILERPEQEDPPDRLWYWKRELLWVQSGLLKRLPGNLKSPRYYRAEETSNGAWIWQELVISHRSEPWSINDYAFAAHQLGLWNGAYLCGEPLPDEPWFTCNYHRSWYTGADPEQDFQFALNQKYIVGDLRKRYERLWAERELFYTILDTLPQSFSHFDSQRRNVFIRKGSDGQEELVLVDWANCGLAPVGADLFHLVGMSSALLEWSPFELPALDQAAFRSYCQGLREVGWVGETDRVRLTYTAFMTLFFGVVFPNIIALWCTPEARAHALQAFGFAKEEAFLQWLPLFHSSLDCADEARSLMKKLKLP